MTDLTQQQKALLDELFKDFKGDAKYLLGENGLIKQLTKRALESALEGELTDHLGYSPHESGVAIVAIPVTARVTRPCKVPVASWTLKSLAIATAASNPRLSVNVSVALRASMTRSSPSMLAD